jgi:hypothetical protein
MLLSEMKKQFTTCRHGHNTRDDAVACCVGQEGLGNCRIFPSCVLASVQPPGFYTTPALRFAGVDDVFEGRSSWHREFGSGLVGCSSGFESAACAALEHVVQGGAATLKKSGYDCLLTACLDDAAEQEKIGQCEEASVDSTGLDAGHRSSHYAWRTGQKRYQLRNWPKLTFACHNATHLILSVLVTNGPSQDAPLLGPVLREASQRVLLDRVLADAGYDSEANHRYARQELGIRSTVIALNKRGRRKWTKSKYRRQLYRRFPKLKYRQRAQVESLISRFKRRLTSTLRGRSPTTQQAEVQLRVLTHNLLILAA